MTIFNGTATAIVTPFKDGKVDYKSFEKLINWQIQCGINGLVVLGTTGEASTLSVKEKIEVAKFAKRTIDNRVPLILGSGSNDTASALFLSKEFEDIGVDGLLVVTPYYNKCSQGGLIDHYTLIADNVDTPIIMYSVKSRTGVNIEPATVKQLSKHPNIVAIKEASGDISQICAISSLISKDFDVYSGNDDQTVPIMALGAKGLISTTSNIVPGEFVKMTDECLKGNYKSARKIQLRLKPLIDEMFKDVNPIPIKSALYQMGKISLEYRLPLCQPSSTLEFEIFDVLNQYHLIKK